jgi:cytosine/adenosine deaminase-related metal-dependent hydrolase
VLGTGGLKAYREQRHKAAAGSIEAEPAGPALMAWVTGWLKDVTSRDVSMTELLDTITPEQPPKGWPSSPRALQAQVAKLAKALRSHGITAEPAGIQEPLTRRALWRFGRQPAPSFNPSDPSDTPDDQHEQREGSGEGSAQDEATKDVKDAAATAAHVRAQGCPRHQTAYGPHAKCTDCQALAEAGQ